MPHKYFTLLFMFILTATTGELGYNVMKKSDNFVSLWTSVGIT
jgi:hypothetical protein